MQLHAALAYDPTHVDTLMVLGKLRARQGDYVAAIEWWEQAVAHAPDHTKARASIRKARELQQRARRRTVLRRTLPSLAVIVAAIFGAVLFSPLLGSNRPQAAQIAQPTAALASPAPTQPVPLLNQVEQSLRRDAELASLNLIARQEGSTVYLSGAVPRTELKARAELLVKGIAGVGAVDSSDLAIAPPDLVKVVEQHLASSPQLAGTLISVEQNGNAVRLHGTVTSAGAKELAERLAGEVAGVALVDSRELVVGAPSLAAAVKQALQADARMTGLLIEVEQVGQGIRLRGRVPNLDTKKAVVLVTLGVPGVELVDADGVRVEPEFVEYIVQRGDSLTTIAQKFYGDATKWPLIYDANRDVILRPSLLNIGTRVVIPVDG
jgi:nucleoid-associated protein YgaU